MCCVVMSACCLLCIRWCVQYACVVVYVLYDVLVWLCLFDCAGVLLCGCCVVVCDVLLLLCGVLVLLSLFVGFAVCLFGPCGACYLCSCGVA